MTDLLACNATEISDFRGHTSPVRRVLHDECARHRA
jgi:hypothetical protein